MRPWLASVLLIVTAAACGGGDDNRAQQTDTPASTPAGMPSPTRSLAPATLPPGGTEVAGTTTRPSVEDQLAIIDGNRSPEQYATLLDSLSRKCRESRTEIADIVTQVRLDVRQERGTLIPILDYLRGMDSVIPAGRTGVACGDLAMELGLSIGR